MNAVNESAIPHFLSCYALKLSPDDPTVKQIRAEFIQAEAEQKPAAQPGAK